jgi:citronellyl-CoA synthetase
LRPTCIRIKSHFDTTATYKINRMDLSKEAFDLEKVSDQLYIMLPGETEYQLLTEDLHLQMMKHQFRFQYHTKPVNTLIVSEF